MALYVLASYPDIQNKLFEEVKQIVPIGRLSSTQT
jgi:hypothetical protein